MAPDGGDFAGKVPGDRGIAGTLEASTGVR